MTPSNSAALSLVHEPVVVIGQRSQQARLGDVDRGVEVPVFFADVDLVGRQIQEHVTREGAVPVTVVIELHLEAHGAQAAVASHGFDQVALDVLPERVGELEVSAGEIDVHAMEDAERGARVESRPSQPSGGTKRA